MLMLFMMEAIVVGLMRNQWPDGEDEDEKSPARFVAEETAQSAIASFPLIREFGSEVAGFRGSSTLGSFYETLGKASTQIGQGELDAALVKSINNVGGIVFKYPSGAINRFGDSLVKDIQGEDVEPIDYLMWREKK